MKAPAKSSGSSSPAAFIPEASPGEGEGLALGPALGGTRFCYITAEDVGTSTSDRLAEQRIATMAQVRRNHV